MTPGKLGVLAFRDFYNSFNGKEDMDLKKKVDVSKIDFGSLLMPVIMGVAAFVTAVADNKKNQKIDELIEKVDKLENKEEA